ARMVGCARLAWGRVEDRGAQVTGMRFRRILLAVAVLETVAVPAALAFGFTDGNHPPDGVVGTPYSYSFEIDEGCKPYMIAVLNRQLPPGLSFTGTTLAGTPTAAGSFFFWLEARDAGCGGGSCPPVGVSCSFPSQRPFTINIAPRLTVTTDSLPPAL